MVQTLIAILGITIMATSSPAYYCTSSDSLGCYWGTKKVVVYDGVDENVYYHELGHAFFDKNEFVQKLIKCYPGYKIETTYILRGADPYKERVANYFSEYMLNEKYFSVWYPCLSIVFRDELNKLKE